MTKSLSFSAPIVSAQLSATGRGLLLELRDSAGRIGRGEASPLPGYSSDTLAECESALRAADWTLGVPTLAPPAAQMAAETALLDLHGQREGQPIHVLLGGRPAATVPLASLVADLPAARAALARGVRTLKVKIGMDPARELALLRAMRNERGDDFALRLDANRRLPAAHAPRLLAALAPLGVEYVEEPTPPDAPLLASPIALAADESLQTVGSPADVIAGLSPLVRVVVLKPMALGGFRRCLALAAAARARGLGVVVTHLMDGRIGVAAAAELALALAVPSSLACGLDRHAADVPQIGTHTVHASSRPGLGL